LKLERIGSGLWVGEEERHPIYRPVGGRGREKG